MRTISIYAVLAAILILCSASVAYEPTTVGNGGTIGGSVTFQGDAPPPRYIVVSKDSDVCGTGTREMLEVSVSPKGGLRNAVIFIETIPHGKAWKSLPDGYILDQKGCRFLPVSGEASKDFGPAILVLPDGQNLTVLNSDPVLHNIHTYEVMGRVRKTLFNQAQPRFKPKMTTAITPSRSQFVKVECDAHNFMHAWIFVAKNPYYALPDHNGVFEITDVPPGTYTVQVWHPTLGIQKTQLEVVAGKKIEIQFKFTGR